MRPQVIFTVAILLASAGNASSATLHSSPFGIRLGAPISSVHTIIGALTEPDMSYSVWPPHPNPAFDTYSVLESPSFGVCIVYAEKDYKSADYAYIQNSFNVVKYLNDNYGPAIKWKPPGISGQLFMYTWRLDDDGGAIQLLDNQEDHSLSLEYDSGAADNCKVEHSGSGL